MKRISPRVKRFAGWMKYPVAGTILYYVLRLVDTQAMIDAAKNSPPQWLLLSLLCFALSQLIAVFRMNAYYHWQGRAIDLGYSVRLHAVALFYNIILPGGIGGDGYKVYLLKRQADFPIKEGIKIQLLTRTNGLLLLLMSIYLVALCLPWPLPKIWVVAGLLAAALASILGYRLFVRVIMRSPFALEWRAMPYSAIVQAGNILSMVCLWVALGSKGNLAGYVLLFQCAAIAGMVPVSIGGLGIRELTFYSGALYLSRQLGIDLNAEQGILISLMMFTITVITALPGFIWIQRIVKMSPCSSRPNH